MLSLLKKRSGIDFAKQLKHNISKPVKKMPYNGWALLLSGQCREWNHSPVTNIAQVFFVKVDQAHKKSVCCFAFKLAEFVIKIL